MSRATPRGWAPACPSEGEVVVEPALWALEELPLAEPDEPASEPARPAAPSALARALEEAEARLAAAEAAHARALAETREAAYAAGMADGAAAERARLAAPLAALEAALAQVHEHAERWTANAEENVSAVAVAVARLVIGRELRGDAAAVAALVRRAMDEFPLRQPLTVRLHPDDLALLAGATGRAPEPPDHPVRWVADPAIASGGCVVEGRERIVDGRVDLALERAYRRLARHHG